MKTQRFFLVLLCISMFGIKNYAQTEKYNQTDAQGNRHGKWMKKFEGSTQKRYEGTFEHGKEIGLFKFYKEGSYNQPVATKKYNTKNDSVHITYYTKKGGTVSEGTMIGKKREGTWRYYHQNEKQELMMIENYKNNQLNGVKKTYLPDGTLAQEETYKEGKLNGPQIIYLKDKQVLQYYTYKNNELHGVTKIYDKAGDLLSEGNYKKGLKDGVWKFYDEGKLVQTITYPLPKPLLKVKKKQTD
ncbi:hypothetical protein RBU60_04595 [Mesonia sp. MT50]|uniref:Preprotein translocase YidC n=2 Tax=Mesonia TaxID=232115 RepID=A0ABU1A1J5_9FLAO|nr:hypothetical protein [Mesonia profundi]MDQ7916843.1 hypothetical protein [Mesonia profundi]